MKRLVTYSVCALCCCVLFLYSPAAVSWASAGFLIWRDSLLPALLPFFVCASVMQNAGVSGRLERASLIFLSLISGAPAGARLLSGYGEPDARSAAILNNVSPIFIYASFCSGMVGCPRLALYILPAQFLSAAIMLILFPIRIKPRPQASFSSPLRLLSNALQSSVSAMLNICAALVFFSALMGGFGAMLDAGKRGGSLSGAVLYGMLEMAGGSAALSKLGIGMRPLGTAAAFVFSFGGLCVYAQSLTFAPLPFLRYFSTKLMQGTLSAAIAYIFLTLFPLPQPVYRSVTADTLLHNTLSIAAALGAMLMALSVVMMIGAAGRYKKAKRKSAPN